MNILSNINKDEKIEINAELNIGTNIKNSIMSNLIYIIMWLAFDVFFIYIMTLEKVQKDFWFVLIPVCGFNLLILWTYVFKLLRIKGEIKDTGYILTNQAIYYYADNKYKQLKRISFEDIVVVEKSEFVFDGFYVASKNETIHVKNIKEEKEMFDILIKKVKGE